MRESGLKAGMSAENSGKLDPLVEWRCCVKLKSLCGLKVEW